MGKYTKEDIQKKVTLNRKPLSMDKFSWDYKTLTFSSDEDNLIIDFSDMDYMVVNASGMSCTIKIGKGCNLYSDMCCYVIAGDECVIRGASDSAYFTGDDCCLYVGEDAILNTGDSCICIAYMTLDHFLTPSRETIQLNDGIIGYTKIEDFKTVGYSDEMESYLSLENYIELKMHFERN